MGANALNAVENIPLNIVYGTKAQEFKNRFNNISDWSVVIP
jgi:hypothetical protein